MCPGLSLVLLILIPKRRLISPDAGKDRRLQEKGRQRMRQLDGITYTLDMNLSKIQEIVKDRGAWRAAVHGVTKNQT